MKNSRVSKILVSHLYGVLLLLFFIGVLSFSSLAQENEYIPSTGITCAYLSSLNFSGFNIGVELPYKVTQFEKFQPKKTKTIYKERYFSYDFGMYHHQTYHTNFIAQADWVARRQFVKGFFLQADFGVGLSRTFLDGATYQVNKHGEVKKVPMAGNFYGLLNFGSSIGYNFNKRYNWPFSFYCKPDLILLMPYNGFIMPTVALELGVSYNVKGIWDTNPKRVYVEKHKKSANRIKKS